MRVGWILKCESPVFVGMHSNAEVYLKHTTDSTIDFVENVEEAKRFECPEEAESYWRNCLGNIICSVQYRVFKDQEKHVHDWRPYVGFTESYQYCATCPAKEYGR